MLPPPANGSRIDGGWLATRRCQYLGMRLGEQLLIMDVFPHHQPFDNAV
jgi:hypothetical protein